MSEHITREDRDALRELASGATSGPWMLDRDQRDGWMVVFGGSGYPHGYNIICSSEYLEPADAAFIAAARTSVPALLDALDRAEVRTAKAEALREAAKVYEAEGLDVNAESMPHHDGSGYATVSQWLRTRADQIEKEDHDE